MLHQPFSTPQQENHQSVCVYIYTDMLSLLNEHEEVDGLTFSEAAMLTSVPQMSLHGSDH